MLQLHLALILLQFHGPHLPVDQTLAEKLSDHTIYNGIKDHQLGLIFKVKMVHIQH